MSSGAALDQPIASQACAVTQLISRGLLLLRE